jgi:hypothetical protein
MKTKEELEQKIECQKDTINQFEDIEIIKDYKQTKKHLKQLKQQLKDLPSLEVGRWYKVFRGDKEKNSLVVFNGHGVSTYGFSHIYQNWTESYGCHNTFSNEEYDYEPATNKEVEEALIKEAKKRGFKEGVKVKCAKDNTEWYLIKNANKLSSGVSIEENFITDGSGAYWFFEGKWATIIKPKTVNLNGDYTEVQLKDVLNSQFNK